MNKLDEIFRKRLARKREELNNYINRNLLISEEKISEEKISSSVEEKFLSYMKLCDESEKWYEADCFEEKERAEKKSLKAPKSAKTIPPESPRSAPSYIPPTSIARGASVPVKIPDFLKPSGERKKLEDVLAKKEETFSQMLLRLIDKKDLKDSDVYKRANIDRRLFSKIRADEDYVPSRKTAISFCLALQLDLDETKKLLATAGYALSASSRFDLIIMYLIETKEYNVHFANIVLDDYGEGTLSR